MDTPKDVVELEVFLDWWIWRPLLPFRDEFQPSRLKDPMDEADFNEEYAFPLLKPSTHALGVPRRTRKQRGWYQVRPGMHAAGPLGDTTPHSTRGAVDCPPEVISRIAKSLPWDISRRELASLASVCRYWADILQPELFGSIRLRSHSDALQLQAFYIGYNKTRADLSELTRKEGVSRAVNPPSLSSGLSFHNQTVATGKINHRQDAEQVLVDEPFLHHLPLIDARRADRSIHWVIKLAGPLPGHSAATVRSIVPLLPRPLPRTYYRHTEIHQLVLENIHFQSFLDLIRLVSALPQLEFLSGVGLTWSRVPAWPLLPAWEARLLSLVRSRHVALKCCPTSQQWLGLWLLKDSLWRCECAALVRQVSESAALQDVEQFEVNCHIKLHRVYWSHTGKWATRHLVYAEWFAPDNRGSLHLGFGAGSSWEMPLEKSPSEEKIPNVVTLCLRFEGDISAWTTSIDWSAFAQTISSFPHLRRIVVVAETNLGQAISYKQHVHHHLELLSRERDLEFFCSSQLPMTVTTDYEYINMWLPRCQVIHRWKARARGS